jgi:hypothetical protein
LNDSIVALVPTPWLLLLLEYCNLLLSIMMKLLSVLLLLAPMWTCAFTTTTTSSSSTSSRRTSTTTLGYYYFSNREHPDDIGADRHLREDRYYWNWDDPSPDSFYREREDLAAKAAGNKGAYDYDAYYGRYECVDNLCTITKLE